MMQMSTLKKGILVKDGLWQKHLRKWFKRNFWHKERLAEKIEIRKEI